MKRTILFFTLCALLLALTGCGSSTETPADEVELSPVSAVQQDDEAAALDDGLPAETLPVSDAASGDLLEGAAAGDVTLTVEQIVDGIATVTISNQSELAFDYSAYYALEKEINGQWYVMPADLAFIDISYILPAGSQDTFECDLTCYGALEPGSYRLVKDGLYAAFTLDESGAYDALDFHSSGVVMTVNDVTAEGAVVTLTNNGEDTGYLWDFVLERQAGDSWTTVPYLEDYGICGVQDPLPAGETVTINLDFAYLFGSLPAGYYRLSMESEGWAAEFDIE